jgi:hypothetical protein
VESSCEFGIEPSGSINAGKLSSGLASSGSAPHFNSILSFPLGCQEMR